jgi:hypothetical protein
MKIWGVVLCIHNSTFDSLVAQRIFTTFLGRHTSFKKNFGFFYETPLNQQYIYI